MVSSGTVNGDLSTLKSHGSTYTSQISGLEGSWKGASHDGIVSKAEQFASEFISTIEGEMTAFATACDLYEQYKTAKENLAISKSNYDKAVSQNDSSSSSSFSSEIAKYQNEMNSLKTQIETNLQTASANKLTATSNASAISSVAGVTTTETDEKAGEKTNAVTGTTVTNGNIIDTSAPVGTGEKYNLTDDEIAYLGYVAKREQGTVGGAKLELSLMVNLYEQNKSKYSSVIDYVKNSGWFGSGSTSAYSYPGDDYIAAAREVISDGNRYLPSNVVEHDCLSDITSISSGSVNDRNSYIPGETVINNRYGARYVFVGFAPDGGDPFGYLV